MRKIFHSWHSGGIQFVFPYLCWSTFFVKKYGSTVMTPSRPHHTITFGSSGLLNWYTQESRTSNKHPVHGHLKRGDKHATLCSLKSELPSRYISHSFAGCHSLLQVNIVCIQWGSFATEAWICFQANPCRIYGEHDWQWDRLFFKCFGFCHHSHSTTVVCPSFIHLLLPFCDLRNEIVRRCLTLLSIWWQIPNSYHTLTT